MNKHQSTCFLFLRQSCRASRTHQSQRVRSSSLSYNLLTSLAGCMLITGTTSLVVALADLKPYVHLQFVPHMSKYHQVSTSADPHPHRCGPDFRVVLAPPRSSVRVYQFRRVVDGAPDVLSPWRTCRAVSPFPAHHLSPLISRVDHSGRGNSG